VGLSYLRARGDLRGFAIFELTNAVLLVTFAALLTPVFGLAGAFASVSLATGLSLTFLAKSLPVVPGLSRSRLRVMLKVGLPVLVSLLLGFALVSADRLIVASLGDMALLGLYGFAFSVAGLAGSLALVIRVVVYPDVYADVTSRGASPALQAHLEGTVLPFARLFPPALGLLAVMLAPVVSILLPAYTDAIPAARLLIFLGVTAGFERLGTLGVIAVKRQKVLPAFSGGTLILNITLSILALRSGLGLQGVAAAALFANFAFGLGVMGFLARVADLASPARMLARLALPLVWSAMLVVLIGWVRPELGVAYTSISLGLYLIGVLPLLPAALSELKKVRRSSIP
jgi:O-antigen/teichoic acid export membrane protein